MKSLFKFGLVAWFVFFLVDIMLIGAVCYVVWHFVSKWW